ncbi:hypothetical protein ZWY2020_046275 [Hordeum vulgare]|nr:hypothetical protein ZWY2020_046275 [Hordeum vulgare]
MVAELGPGRFYGGGLPRPRVFPGGDRADPPALLSWAREAQWSTGGRGGRRLRLQGRIEGSLGRLRRADALGSDDDKDEEDGGVAAQERQVVDDKDDEEESGESDEDEEESGESEQDEEESALVNPARWLQRKKAVAPASAPSAKAPAKASPKRKASAAGLTARTSPTRKRKAAEATAAGRRTSPRAKH